jgi:hypothetical protein
MFKKIISVTLVFVFLITLSPASVSAVNINEDVSVALPVYENMEATTNFTGIAAQLTGEGSGVALSTDAAEGKFSWQVTAAAQIENPYALYTLVNSDAFDIAEYSSIKVWVKPGNGASWISFYTNNALITCDKDGDGQFEVDTDLTAGKWTQLTLDLLNTDTVITTGDDLVVRSNDNSVWSLDEVKSQGTKSTSIDLSTMVNGSTTFNDGKLQFSKTGDGLAYNTEPTTLISNRNSGIELLFEKQIDFTGGTFINCSAPASGGIVFDNPSLCNGGTVISGGDLSGYSSSFAFHGTLDYFWVASQTNGAQVGNAYIGYSFPSSQIINGVSIYNNENSCVTSAYLQYYNGSSWISIGTIPIVKKAAYQTYWLNSNVSASRWRLLAASIDPTQTSLYSNWSINEVKFFNNIWSYTSLPINISTLDTISQAFLTCSTSVEASVNIETSLSFDGGTSWLDWSAINEDGIINGLNRNSNLQNARIKYKISGQKAVDANSPEVYSIKLSLQGNDTNSACLKGTIQGIRVDSSIVNASGNPTSAYNISTLSALRGVRVFSLSGDGKKLLYSSAFNGNLYSFDMTSGVSSLVATLSSLNLISITCIQVNYDGTICAIIGAYDSNYSLLVKYDMNASVPITQLTTPRSSGTKPITCAIQDSGGILYAYCPNLSNAEYLSYCSPSNVITSMGSFSMYQTYQPDIAYLDIADSTTDFICYRAYGGQYSLYFNNSILCSSGVGSEFISSDGNRVFYNGLEYNRNTNVTRNLNAPGPIIQVVDGNNLLIGQNKSLYLYNPTSGSNDLLSYASDWGSSIIADKACNTIVYKNTSNDIRVISTSNSDRVNKYLLSFDGKNTWFSYSSGTWVKVSDKKTPDVVTLTKYGMTTEQVNALTGENFEPLYADGNEIYTVDVAVYFQSVSPNYSPSINSIKIITNTNSYGDAAGTTANPLYAVKKEDFTGSSWRKVNRIYPVEICNKASDYVYFIYVDEQYVYFNGTTWVSSDSVSISGMLPNPGPNWAMLSYYGMSAEQVRAIPAAALTSELAFKDFSVVYCLRVPDISTRGYYSIINVDYTKNLYESDTLTLIITYFDSRTMQIPGITSEQIEDFMDWLLNRTKKSPIYYSIKVGGVNYYINYNMICDVSVTES